MDYVLYNLLNDIINTRRYIHMYPEKSFCERNTSKYIADYLKKLNIDVIDSILGTGVIGIIKGRIGKSSIAFRADMDCIEVNENNDIEFCSRYKGLMHACGHDGHIAALLGLAEYIINKDITFNDNIILIFQPAEEGPGGAEPIVKSGTLDKFNIKAFVAMHIFPEIEQGRIGCCSGPITARNGEIDISLTGRSAHGALPHKGFDSIIASSQLINAFQTIISRKIDPRENAVFTIGKIYGGEARNIIAGNVNMEGTIRTFSEEVYRIIKENIKKISRGIEEGNDCNIDIQIRDMYPEVFNDDNLFKLLLSIDKENVDIIKPLMIAEDFSYYKLIAPEIMFLLGSKNDSKGFIHPLHNSRFNFDESILLYAIWIFFNMIEKLDTKLQ